MAIISKGLPTTFLQQLYLITGVVHPDMTILRDVLLTLVVMGVPAYLVIRGGWRGLVVAIPVMWISGYLAGEIQRAADPVAERFSMAVWIVSGCVLSLASCGLIYGVRQLALFWHLVWGSGLPRKCSIGHKLHLQVTAPACYLVV